MKKAVIATALFWAVSLGLTAQSFDLPQATNTVDSVERALEGLVFAMMSIGIPERGTTTANVTGHLDSVLVYMGRDSLQNHTRLIRASIDSIDASEVSINRMAAFEHRLRHIVSANWHEIGTMQNRYRTQPFPLAIALDEIAIAEKREAVAERKEIIRGSELVLDEYRLQLAALPTVAQQNNRLQAIRRELISNPNVLRNPALTRELEEEAAEINRQRPLVEAERRRLQGRISAIQSQIRHLDTDLDRFIATMETEERTRLIAATWAGLFNFHAWEGFFLGENTYIKDFFILNNTEMRLRALLDDIPQGQIAVYRQRVDAFLAGWGL